MPDWPNDESVPEYYQPLDFRFDEDVSEVWIEACKPALEKLRGRGVLEWTSFPKVNNG